MKLQTEWDLRSGAVTHVEIEPGRSPDGATCRQDVRRGAGSLRITDLGYFNLGVFAAMTQAGEYFLSRLQPGTGVLLPGGEALDLRKWLDKQPGPFIDQWIELGKKQRLSCRLIAWRVPEEQANRRRQKLRQESLSKYGKEPSAERLAWCDWTILVTNVPADMMTPEEAVILYRARWQVELLFKRWKSQDLVAVLRGSTAVRQMVGIWSRLLAALVQHWLMIASAWGDPTKSLSKVCEAIRRFVGRLAAGMDDQTERERVLTDLCRIVAKSCRRNKRSKPGTFELLNDVSLLDFCLT
jgi:Transposase DDE domain